MTYLQEKNGIYYVLRMLLIPTFSVHFLVILTYTFHVLYDYVRNIDEGSVIKNLLLFILLTSNVSFLLTTYLSYIVTMILKYKRWISRNVKQKRKIHLWIGTLSAFFASIMSTTCVVYISLYDTIFTELFVSIIVFCILLMLILFVSFLTGAKSRSLLKVLTVYSETDQDYTTNANVLKNKSLTFVLNIHEEISVLLILLSHASLIYYMCYMIANTWFYYDIPSTDEDFKRPADITFKWVYYFPSLMVWLLWKIFRRLFKDKYKVLARIIFASILFCLDCFYIFSELYVLI